MKKIFSAISATILTASLLVIPVSAEQATTQNSSTKGVVQLGGYCPTCNAVGIPYPKKDYKRSDFNGTSIQYQGSTYYFSFIDDNLTTDTHWWTVWIK
ncbi:hypothetical protein MKX50_24730 [Paenibacillus sp. FSL W8-0186]|uniref:Uncharacterized protein n=1 Tax=Paenibacillus woosongensis TaxID=307580 RepID=A0A7X2Z525_9BACL|nr:hypothetical protein [Paenibacillus woosongensis]MUG47703.1 hypothetical protein [Paenibacillus woosongensis]GIP59014.1 hypothetical protein J15TS10_28280 [Paenibacillus woosongensis]